MYEKRFSVATFRECVISIITTDLGLKIGDFLPIKKGNLPDFILEAPKFC
jgi:hypothetical protein